MKIDHFSFYRSYFEAIQDLSDKNKLKLYDAICRKALNNETVPVSGIVKTLFTLIAPNLENNRVNIINGQKGGRPKQKPPLKTPLKNPPLEKQETYKDKDKEKEEEKKKSKKKKKEIKKYYAEFVSMTEKEYQTLCDEYTTNIAERCIDKLNNYKGANGKEYKSDYRAILSWVLEKVVDEYCSKDKKGR